MKKIQKLHSSMNALEVVTSLWGMKNMFLKHNLM